jgi:RNA polymerase sigma-70 factor (sigma-E family)
MARGADRGRDDEFSEYYAGRGSAMRATAYLLCGDWQLAEDVVQIAFTKLYLAWYRVQRREQLDQYMRRIITRSLVDERRRPWRRERASSLTVDDAVTGPAVEDRMVLRAVLAALPARQRATLVLRYWEDLSVEETARILGVSTGTVKSQCARGLQTLRDRLGSQLPALEYVE